jgi:hypothetical protein
MRSIARGLVAAVVLLAFSGCATIFHGSREAIPVQSSPAGATVTTNPSTGQYTTPTILNLARKESYVLSFSHEGYSPASCNVQNNISGGYVVADVLLTGLVGVIVDGVTGAWYNLSPDQAVVSLTKVGDGPGPASITVSLDAINHGRGLRITSDDPGVNVTVTNRR